MRQILRNLMVTYIILGMMALFVWAFYSLWEGS